MNWFISFNVHAFIKSNRYTEKLLHGESMQAGIVYLLRSLSFFPFLSHSLLFSSFSLLRLFNNPPPRRKSAEIRGEHEPPRRLHCRWYSDQEFHSFFSVFCSDFCLINMRMEGKAAETYRRYCYCSDESETTMRIFCWTSRELQCSDDVFCVR